MADLADAILAAGGNPQTAQFDGQMVVAHPLISLIAADQYLAAKASMSRRKRGLRFTKLIMPSHVGNTNTGNGVT